MRGCIYRTNDNECDRFSDRNKGILSFCDIDNCEFKKRSNADRIRAMTDEELDKFLGEVQWDVANYCGGVTQKQEFPVPEHRGAWIDWLSQEAADG